MPSTLDDILARIEHPTDISATILSEKKGLPNISNTCYLNSVLQVILHMLEFQKFFLFSGDILKPILLTNKDYHRVNVGAKIYELFITYWTSDDYKTIHKDLRYLQKILSEHIAMTSPEFHPGQQCDQHECLVFLLDIMHQSFCIKKKFIHDKGDPDSYHDELENKAIESIWRHGFHGPDCLIKEGYMFVSTIASTLMGQRIQRTECANPTCRAVSPIIDTFKIFEVHIPKMDGTIDLTDCMNYATGITRLHEDNMYKCEKCGEETEACKRSMIWRHPQILIIQIIRNLVAIRNTPHGPVCHQMKDTREVTFPQKLDLKPYMYRSNMSHTNYELINVGCHHGYPGFGHCYSYIKNDDSQWSNYNDHRVTDITDEYVQGPEAYLLVYRQMT